MEVLSSLFTILIIVSLGILSRKAGIFKAEHAKTLSSFVYYFGLPALFFVKLANQDLASLDSQLLLGALLPTVIVLALLLILKWIGFLKKETFILLGLSISFGSYAFFGIAFFETFQNGIWLENAIIAASPLGVLGIISTLLLLEYANHKKKSASVLIKVFTNPLILAVVLGIGFSLLGIKLLFLDNALKLIGQTSSAMAIFVLGMFIFDRFSLEIIKTSLPYSLFRMIALPAVALLVIKYILPGPGGIDQFVLLMNGMPAAIALVVFAERYDYRVTETSGVVSLTSLLSFLGLTGIYYLAKIIL